MTLKGIHAKTLWIGLPLALPTSKYYLILVLYVKRRTNNQYYTTTDTFWHVGPCPCEQEQR